MNLSKNQKIVLSLVIFALGVFIYRRKKSQEESSFINFEKCYDLNSYNRIGDNFLSLNSGICKNLAKKYIDGTIQQGIIIDSLGNARIGEIEDVTIPSPLGGTRTIKMRKLIPVPSDKGFKKNDGFGNYFYFEELPEWKKAEIKKLEEQKIAADKAEVLAREIKETTARNEAIRLAREQKIAFEKAKREAEIKNEAEATKKMIAKQTADKNKKIIIVVIVIAIAIAIFFVWKKYKKQ